MKFDNLASYLMIIGVCTGCATSVEPDSTESPCQGMCNVAQVCRANVCYDTCSLNSPCSGVGMTCVNSICVAREMSCVPDTRKCSEDGRSVLACLDGYDYVLESYCAADESCEFGACIKEACENGVKRCHENNVEICQNNGFKIYSECDSPQECSEVDYTCEIPPECLDERKRCDENGNVQICSEGQWVDFQQCQAGYACSTSKLDCVETAACENGTYKCNANSVYACAEHQWQYMQDCGDQICDGGRCVPPECQEGQSRCYETNEGMFRQVCSKNTYDTYPCVIGETCVLENGAAACVKNNCESAYKCENNKLFKCEGNAYEEVMACGSDETCSADEATCRPNCGNNVLDVGEECDGIHFKEGLTCSSKVTNSSGVLSCTVDCHIDASGCQQSCEEGSASCEGDTYKACVGKKWTYKDCEAEGKKCGNNGCYASGVTGEWADIQDFESLPVVSEQTVYSVSNDYTDKAGIRWRMTGRTQMKQSGTDYSIEGQGLIIREKDSNSIEASQIQGGVGKLVFDWRGWNKDSGKVEVSVGSKKETLSFTTTDTAPSTYELEVNDSKATKISIVPTGGGRFIIDNIRWTSVK